VVVCKSLAVAQAVIQSLGLGPAETLRSVAPMIAGRGKSSTLLAVIVECDPGECASTLRAAKRQWPQAKTLLVGVPNQEDLILQAFAAGADGIVLAEESLQQVAQAVPDVLAGLLRPPPAVTRALFDRLVWLDARSSRDDRRTPVRRLSARETQILERLTRGESNKEIAVGLHVEVQTIKNHVTRILHKLNVHSRFDAARAGAATVRSTDDSGQVA